MKHLNLIQSILFAAAFSAGAVELPLTNPPVPFVKKQPVGQEKSKPVFDAAGKRIVFGSKVLQFSPSGTVSYIDSGKMISEVYYYTGTKYSGWITSLIPKATPPVKYKRQSFGIDSFTADEKTKSFIVKGHYPCQKPGEPEVLGHYRYTVTLLPTKKVRFLMESCTPDGVNPAPVTIIWKTRIARKFQVPGKEGPAIPVDNRQFSFNTPKYMRILTGVESETFQFNPKRIINMRLGREGALFFATYSKQNKKDPKHIVVEFEFDPLTWGNQTQSGAADLKAVDDLDPEIPASRNLMQNPYFAQGLNHVASYNYAAGWMGTEIVKLSKTNPKFGENCLMVNHNAGLSVQVPMISAEPGEYTYSWYARTDAEKGGTTGIYVSNHAYNYILKKSRRFPVGKEWKRYQVTVKVPNVTGMRAQINVNAKENGPYKVYLDGLQLEKGNKATAFDCSPATSRLMTSAADDFIRHGDRINGKLRLSTLKDNVSGTLNVSVQDMFGTELYKTASKFAFGKKEHPEIPLALDGKIPDGVFKVKVDFDVSGKKYTEYFRFSVMPFFQNKHKLKSFFAQRYFGSAHYMDAYPGYENYLKRSMYYGVGNDIHSPTPKPAMAALYKKYNAELLDTIVGNRAHPQNIKRWFPNLNPLPGHVYYHITFNDNGWSLSDRSVRGMVADHRLCGGWTPEHRRKIVEAAEKYAKKGPMFRVYNTGAEWPHEIKNDPHYVDLMCAIREGVKKAYPNALFAEGGSYNMDVGGGVAEIDNFISRAKGKMPIEAIHCHFYTKDQPAVETNFKALVNVAENKHGLKNVKYFFGEGMSYGPYEVPAWGLESADWSGHASLRTNSTISYDMGWTERHSAAYYMRTWLIFLTKINQVLGATSAAVNANAVCMDVQMRPRIYQKVPNTISVFLGNAKRFVRDVSFAKDTKCLIWEDEKNRPVAVVWYQDTVADLGKKSGQWASVKLPAGTEIFDMMGVKRTARTDGNIPVSVFPFFFRGKPGQAGAFVKAFANAEIIGDTSSPFRTKLDIVSRTEATLTIENFKACPVSGRVTAGGKTVNVNLQPLGTARFKAPLTPAIPYDNPAKITTKYSVTTNGKTTEASDSFVGLAVKRFTGDWSRIPSFGMNPARIGGKTTAADFSAHAQLAWDKDYFYIRVTVTDDKFVHDEHPNPAQRFSNDSMQIFIDTRCSAQKKKIRTFDEDDYAYTFIFDRGKPKLFRWRTPDIQLTLGVVAPKDMTVAEDIPCKFTKTKDGYVYETAIPARYMLPARLEKNHALALALYLNGRDEGKKIKHGLTTTPKGTGAYNKPHLYPVILLTE